MLSKPYRLILISIIILILCPSCNTTRSPEEDISSSQLTSVKIFTETEGIYQISLSQLGWEGVDPTNLQLTFQGETQPLWTNHDTIFFYSEPPNNSFTTKNFYILSKNGSNSWQPNTTYSSSEHTQTTAYSVTKHIEENQNYQPKSLDSPWLDQKIIAPQTITIPITLDAVSTGAGKLQVRLWGQTQTHLSPDHHIQLSLNGHQIADQTWDGQTAQTITAPIPANALITGENILEITAPGDTEAAVDIVFLDWVEITYQRETQPQGDVLIFAGEDTPLWLGGFKSAPTVFDVTDPQQLSPVDSTPDEPTFTGEPGHRYVAVGPQGYLSPAGISPLALNPDLTSPTTNGDYLAIGPTHLLAELEPLLEHRQKQGLRIMSIPLEAVYDQFGDGFPHPLAIRSFLQYAVQNWETPPRYVLLVGDATYDPLGYKFSTEGHLLPTFPVNTQYGGQTGSDIPLAQLDDASEDPWPDLAIGRIPARTPEQVQIFVEKTLAYENTPPDSSWSSHIFAVADGQEASFSENAQTFLDYFSDYSSDNYQTTLLAPQAGDTTAAQEIEAVFEEGAFLTAYFGHGSVQMWGKDKLFTTENAAELENEGRLPIVLNFTCLAGLFTHPTVESLAESLLWNPRGGAVAVLAPSSLTLPDSQSSLSGALAQGIISPPGDIAHAGDASRLGDVILQAWRQVPSDDAHSLDVMQTFMLFGDPALVIER